VSDGDIWAWYEEEIRTFMLDRPDYNILLEGVEFTPKEIERALCRTVSEYNSITPISITTTVGNINTHLAVTGAASRLLMSESMRQARNQVSFQTDDNEAVGVDDKAPLYLQLAGTLRSQFREGVEMEKKSRNMEGGYGCISSGYRNITRYNG